MIVFIYILISIPFLYLIYLLIMSYACDHKFEIDKDKSYHTYMDIYIKCIKCGQVRHHPHKGPIT